MPTVNRYVLSITALACCLVANLMHPAAAQNFIPPGTPMAQPMVPQAGPDGTVYLNDASLYDYMGSPVDPYGAGAMPPGSYGAYPSPGYNEFGPMYCPPTCPQPMALQPAPPVCNNVQEQVKLYGMFLYLHPVGADMHFAQQQNGTGGAGTTPFGQIAVADPNYNTGVRVGGIWALDGYTGIGASYTFFESDSVGSVDAPDIPLGTVGSLVHHPGAVVTSSAGPVDASYEINFQTGEIDTRHLIVGTCNRWVYGTLGARWGELEQEFSTRGVYAGSQGGNIITDTNLEYQGAGLRIGIEGEQLVGQSRLFVYGNAFASSLVGEMSGSYRMHNASTVTDLAIVTWEDDRIVPTLEYELGLAWLNRNGCLRLSVGYTMMHWFNVATTPVFIDAVQANNYVNISDTLTFSGVTSRVEWRY